MLRGALFSLALHGTLVLLLLAASRFFPGHSPQALPVLAEVELVEQNTPSVGREATQAAAPGPAAIRHLAAKPALPSQPPPLPRTPAAPPLLPLPPPSAPTPHPPPSPPEPSPPEPSPRARPRPAQQAPPALAQLSEPAQPAAPAAPPGAPGSTGTGLVSGSQVIPAALDRTVRNVPPAYPPQAVRAGEQGSVLLKVHVAANGTAAAVDIFQSSGYRLLDEAARQAVGRWHFIPGRKGGAAVPSTMLLRIRFRLTNPEGGQ